MATSIPQLLFQSNMYKDGVIFELHWFPEESVAGRFGVAHLSTPINEFVKVKTLLHINFLPSMSVSRYVQQNQIQIFAVCSQNITADVVTMT